MPTEPARHRRCVAGSPPANAPRIRHCHACGRETDAAEQKRALEQPRRDDVTSPAQLGGHAPQRPHPPGLHWCMAQWARGSNCSTTHKMAIYLHVRECIFPFSLYSSPRALAAAVAPSERRAHTGQQAGELAGGLAQPLCGRRQRAEGVTQKATPKPQPVARSGPPPLLSASLCHGGVRAQPDKLRRRAPRVSSQR